MEPTDVVRQLWARIQARDWAGYADLLADEVVMDWPATAERFVGRSDLVRVNADYPEGWSIHVRRVLGDGDLVASEVDVPHPGLGTFAAASFFRVQDGLVKSVREYWVTVGGEAAPDWRRKYHRPA
jgi:ketosteroid isomerase-like protein